LSKAINRRFLALKKSIVATKQNDLGHKSILSPFLLLLLLSLLFRPIFPKRDEGISFLLLLLLLELTCTWLKGFRYILKSFSIVKIAGSTGIIGSANEIRSLAIILLYSVCSRAIVSRRGWSYIWIISVSLVVCYFSLSLIGTRYKSKIILCCSLTNFFCFLFVSWFSIPNL
jgi:hypothetical protein